MAACKAPVAKASMQLLATTPAPVSSGLVSCKLVSLSSVCAGWHRIPQASRAPPESGGRLDARYPALRPEDGPAAPGGHRGKLGSAHLEALPLGPPGSPEALPLSSGGLPTVRSPTPPDPLARILLVGGGCLGRQLARTLTGAGHAVRITTRSPESPSGDRGDPSASAGSLRPLACQACGLPSSR